MGASISGSAHSTAKELTSTKHGDSLTESPKNTETEVCK